MKPITILLVEDHTIVSESFSRMLEMEDDFEVVGQVHDGRQAVLLSQKCHPQVILMDIAMPGLNGLEAARQILKQVPTPAVIMLSAHNDDAYVTQTLELGASGFLLKQDSALEVCKAIRLAVKGKKVYSTTISRRLDRIQRNMGELKTSSLASPPKLTPRELEVLQLIAEGKANKQAADVLKIGIKTVEKHRAHIASKLDLHGTADFTRYAVSTGLIKT